MGEDPALEDHARHQRWSIASGMRRLPRSRGSARRGRRRQNEDFYLRAAFRERGQRPLFKLPRGWNATYERAQLAAFTRGRELHFLPFTAPRADQRVLTREIPAGALLRVPFA